MKKVLVIIAHPDDEVIGLGGTIAKHTRNGDKVYLSVITDGSSVGSDLDELNIIEKRKKECLLSSRMLGITEVFFHNFKDAKLDILPQIELNKAILIDIKKVSPDIVYTHNEYDLHSDHRAVSNATRIATRREVKEVYMYEIISSSINFKPDIYNDISKDFDKKVGAMKCYKSILKESPHPLSIESLTAISNIRGIESGLKFAEALKV